MICGLPLRAERISSASSWLANASAAVLLAAIMFPTVESCRTVVCRSLIYSYVKTETSISSKTIMLVSKLIAINFRRIGMFLSSIGSIPSRTDDLGGPEELGADCQIGTPGNLKVYYEANSVIFGDQTNHSATYSKVINIAYRENVPAFQMRENLVHLVGFRLADEQNVAGPDLRSLM